MSEQETNVTKIHSINENEPSEIIKVDNEEPKPKEIHPKNLEIWNREFIYPLLAADYKKTKKDYGKEGVEKLFTRFKKLSDPSIPYKKVVTSIVRIRTLSNKEQALGEYIFYLANLYGYQKHFDPETSQINIFESVHMLNVPFLTDKKLNMTPDYQNGVFKGYKSVSEYSFFLEKFVPQVSIDTIIENSDLMENMTIRYSFKDMGKDYGGYSREELSTMRADKLVSRNVKKEMGTEINEDDKHQTLKQVSNTVTNAGEGNIEEVPKSGKRK